MWPFDLHFPSDDPKRNDEITCDLRNLNNLAKVLKNRRIESGALQLSSPDVKFVKDEEKQVRKSPIIFLILVRKP